MGLLERLAKDVEVDPEDRLPNAYDNYHTPLSSSDAEIQDRKPEYKGEELPPTKAEKRQLKILKKHGLQDKMP